jgi:hypothetical protein
LRAAKIIRENPDATIREIAASAGISQGTARSVQARLKAGHDPVQTTSRRSVVSNGQQDTSEGDGTKAAPRSRGPVKAALQDRQTGDDIGIIFEKLSRDPAFRHSEAGRSVLQIIRAKTVDGHSQSALTLANPPHARPLLARLARYNANIWMEIARSLDME